MRNIWKVRKKTLNINETELYDGTKILSKKRKFAWIPIRLSPDRKRVWLKPYYSIEFGCVRGLGFYSHKGEYHKRLSIYLSPEDYIVAKLSGKYR